MKKALIIVDLQQGFKNEGNQFVFNNVNKLNLGQYSKIYATQFFNDKTHNPNYVKILNWNELTTPKETNLAINLPNIEIVKKYGYSLPEDFITTLKKNKIEQVDICGTDYDSCVLSIGFQIFDAGIVPKFYKNAIGTHSKSISLEEIEKVYTKNFGKDCFIEA